MKRLKRLYWYLTEKLFLFIRRKTNIPICHGADGPCFRKGKRRRQNTAYCDDELNWVFFCDKCQEMNEEYWAERWSDYYSMLGI